MMKNSINLTRIYGMFVVGLTCVLNYILAASTCPAITDNIKIAGWCNSNGSVTPWDCQSCQPGYGFSVECGRVYENGTIFECQPCKDGETYSTTYDISQCKPCPRCPKNEVQTGQCLRNKNSIKCSKTCKQGYYRDASSRSCMPCSWCCGDGSNKAVPECKNLEKKCSYLQNAEFCAPTTLPPTKVTTTATPSTNPSTTETSTSSSSTLTTDPETTFTRNISSELNSLNTTETPIEQQNPNNLTKISKGSTGQGKNKWILEILLPISIIVVFIAIVALAVCCWRKRCGNSSGVESAQVSRSSSTSNELSSSVPLLELPKDKEKGKCNKEDDEKIDVRVDGTAYYEKGTAKASLLMASESQGSVEDSVPGTSGADMLGTSSMTCTCNNTPSSSHPQNNVDHLSKEQKLDLLVTEIPFKIYRKICTTLDVEDQFFRDYRIVAEKLGVSKEQTRLLQKNQTHSLLIELEHKPNVRRFLDILKETDREDVMEIIEAWLDKELLNGSKITDSLD